jgi:hypothetical protein
MVNIFPTKMVTPQLHRFNSLDHTSTADHRSAVFGTWRWEIESLRGRLWTNTLEAPKYICWNRKIQEVITIIEIFTKSMNKNYLDMFM